LTSRVTLSSTVAMRAQPPVPVAERSTSYPVSSSALSCHSSRMRLPLIPVAVRPEGAAGTVPPCVVALAVPLYPESPLPFVARTR